MQRPLYKYRMIKAALGFTCRNGVATVEFHPQQQRGRSKFIYMVRYPTVHLLDGLLLHILEHSPHIVVLNLFCLQVVTTLTSHLNIIMGRIIQLLLNWI